MPWTIFTHSISSVIYRSLNKEDFMTFEFWIGFSVGGSLAAAIFIVYSVLTSVADTVSGPYPQIDDFEDLGKGLD